MKYQLDESAKWSQAVQKVTDELETATQTGLDKNASRGFAAPTGPTLALLLQTAYKAQMTLTEENAKIYAEQRERIFKIEEFDLSMAVEANKLALAWYKAEVLNVLAVEQAYHDARVDEWRADIIRLNAATEKREVAIIRAKADIEHELNGYKEQKIQAQYQTLGAEIELVNAKIATAEAKLGTIQSLWEIIAAEQLVIVAERRRAVALELVAAAKERLAAIQKEMKPLYMEKAKAKEALAAATIKEAGYKEETEKLGYRKIELKDAEQDTEHQLRQSDLNYELAKELLAKISTAADLLREQSRVQLRTYQTEVEAALLARENALKERGFDLGLSTEYQRKKMGYDADVALSNYNANLVTTELTNKLQDITSTAQSDAAAVESGATQRYETEAVSRVTKIVHKGSYA